MNFSWYPWQLFVRKKEVVIPVALALLVAFVLTFLLEYKLQRVPQPVFLHYSVELGVDALGSPHLALLLPAVLLAYVFINTLIGNVLLLTSRTAALIVVWHLAVAALWFGLLVIRANGA